MEEEGTPEVGGTLSRKRRFLSRDSYTSDHSKHSAFKRLCQKPA